MEDHVVIDILIILALFILLLVLGVLSIIAPTVPGHDSFRLAATGVFLISLLGYRFLNS